MSVTAPVSHHGQPEAPRAGAPPGRGPCRCPRGRSRAADRVAPRAKPPMAPPPGKRAIVDGTPEIALPRPPLAGWGSSPVARRSRAPRRRCHWRALRDRTRPRSRAPSGTRSAIRRARGTHRRRRHRRRRVGRCGRRRGRPRRRGASAPERTLAGRPPVRPDAAGALIARLLAYAGVAVAGGFLLAARAARATARRSGRRSVRGALLTGVLVEARRSRT